jgi:eukaryotic-like serine/threonine-protein kinase
MRGRATLAVMGTSPLEPGSLVGPYRIVQPLGEGAMGIVFEAVREPEGQTVALKVLRPELSSDEVFRQRFAHEARAAGEVRHRYLVPILDAGEADSRSYLAVEFVRGPSLERRLADGPLALPEVVRLVAHLGAALDALHRAGLVHRDVKPGNVMVDEAGTALLTDFGLAKGPAYTVLTRPGAVMGTLDYLAPELIRGGEATPATDLYALGGVAYEAVAGRPPFGDVSMFELASAHLNRSAEDPTRERSDVPPGVAFAILRALAKEPSERPPTGTAFANMLTIGAGASSS